MRIDELLREKHDEILEVAGRHGAVRIRLFGSAARGEATEESDLDLLVDMRPGSSLLDIVAIKQDLEDLLGVNVHVVTGASISPYIKDDVFKEAVNL